MADESKIRALFERLIDRMEKQATNAEHQSVGSLAYHLDLARGAQRERSYLSPLYILQLPRWLGEIGNTPLEDEISSISYEISEEAIRLCGGREAVNAAREQHNAQRRKR